MMKVVARVKFQLCAELIGMNPRWLLPRLFLPSIGGEEFWYPAMVLKIKARKAMKHGIYYRQMNWLKFEKTLLHVWKDFLMVNGNRPVNRGYKFQLKMFSHCFLPL